MWGNRLLLDLEAISNAAIIVLHTLQCPSARLFDYRDTLCNGAIDVIGEIPNVPHYSPNCGIVGRNNDRCTNSL